MKRSYGLAEVAAAHLPAEWTDAERWLRRRLNRKELIGFRVGRVWRMTDDDVDFLISKYRNITSPADPVKPEPVAPVADAVGIAASLSPRSRRRLMSAG